MKKILKTHRFLGGESMVFGACCTVKKQSCFVIWKIKAKHQWVGNLSIVKLKPNSAWKTVLLELISIALGTNKAIYFYTNFKLKLHGYISSRKLVHLTPLKIKNIFFIPISACAKLFSSKVSVQSNRSDGCKEDCFRLNSC